MTGPEAQKQLVDDMAALAFVQASPLFKSLEQAHLSLLLESARLEDWQREGFVLEEGQSDDGLYMILEGKVSVCKRQAELLLELATLDRGGVFGEIAVLTRQPRSASVITRTSTRLIRFAGEAVRQVADVEPRFGRMLAGLMAGRSKDTERKLGEG